MTEDVAMNEQNDVAMKQQGDRGTSSNSFCTLRDAPTEHEADVSCTNPQPMSCMEPYGIMWSTGGLWAMCRDILPAC